MPRVSVALPALAMLLCPCVGARADGWTQPAGTLWRNAYVAYGSAQRQFGASGRFTHLFYDGAFAMVTIGGSIEYGALDGLTLTADLPLAHVWFVARDSTHDYTRSLTLPSYLALGARWRVLYAAATSVAVSGTVHLPPGWHHGLYDDPAHPFLSDGFLEGIVALEAGTRLSWGWVEGAVAWHGRTEEASDQAELRAAAGFTARPGAVLKLSAGVVKTLAPLPARPLDAEQTVAQEHYAWVGVQLSVELAPAIAVGGSLGFRVWGEHTLALNGGGLNVQF